LRGVARHRDELGPCITIVDRRQTFGMYDERRHRPVEHVRAARRAQPAVEHDAQRLKEKGVRVNFLARYGRNRDQIRKSTLTPFDSDRFTLTL